MYDWVDFTHNHLAGQCPHLCQYCSTQDLARRFPAMAERYSGPPRLIKKELVVNYGTGKTIFIENCSDLFAEGIAGNWICDILEHCRDYSDNTYVFQTKNPGAINNFSKIFFPPRLMIGTTAESNRPYLGMSKAPPPSERLRTFMDIGIKQKYKFITIEPILRFDLVDFCQLLTWADAGTIYIGADSKNHGLPEPTSGEIGDLIKALQDAGKTVVLKSNLKRLYKGA